MTDLNVLFPPPWIVQRRAWECVLVVAAAFGYGGPLLRRPIDAYTWEDCRQAVALYRANFAART